MRASEVWVGETWPGREVDFERLRRAEEPESARARKPQSTESRRWREGEGGE